MQAGASEGQVQQEDGVSADEPQEHLADTEDDCRCGAEAVDQQRADSHAEQGDAGGETEAEDGVAQEVGGGRAQDELVDEAADRGEQGRGEQGDVLASPDSAVGHGSPLSSGWWPR